MRTVQPLGPAVLTVRSSVSSLVAPRAQRSRTGLDAARAGAFLRLPLEASGVPRRRPRAAAAGSAGSGRSWPSPRAWCSALSAVVRILDMGFLEALNRPFDVAHRLALRRLARRARPRTPSASAPGRCCSCAAVLAAVALLVLLPRWRCCGSRGVAARHRQTRPRSWSAARRVWLVARRCSTCAAVPAPSRRATRPATSTARSSRIPAELRDQREFAEAARADPLARRRPDELLTGLAGRTSSSSSSRATAGSRSRAPRSRRASTPS